MLLALSTDMSPASWSPLGYRFTSSQAWISLKNQDPTVTVAPANTLSVQFLPPCLIVWAMWSRMHGGAMMLFSLKDNLHSHTVCYVITCHRNFAALSSQEHLSFSLTSFLLLPAPTPTLGKTSLAGTGARAEPTTQLAALPTQIAYKKITDYHTGLNLWKISFPPLPYFLWAIA